MGAREGARISPRVGSGETSSRTSLSSAPPGSPLPPLEGTNPGSTALFPFCYRDAVNEPVCLLQWDGGGGGRKDCSNVSYSSSTLATSYIPDACCKGDRERGTQVDAGFPSANHLIGLENVSTGETGGRIKTCRIQTNTY